MIKLCDYCEVTEDFARDFYMEEYRAHMNIQGLTIATIQHYISILLRFIKQAKFTSYQDFDNFVKLKMAYYNLAGKTMGNNTIYKHYKCIRKYTDFLKANELIQSVHITKIPKIKTTKPLPKSMSEVDVKKMREYILRP